MRFKSISLVVALVLAVAAPIRLQVRPTGEGLTCSVKANDAEAKLLCWCDPRQYVNDCTVPNYIYVCPGSESEARVTAAAASSSSEVEKAAWLLDHPIG